MIKQTYTLDIITPCFCGGANASEQAEIRPASIRGQLRWWFRVLGGFKSLAPMKLRDQEDMIFGSAAAEEGTAGKLMVRVSAPNLFSEKQDGQGLGHRNFSDPAYLTFPIQTRNGDPEGHAGRGAILEGRFQLSLIWRGDPGLASDFGALITVFGNLGSLGFRSRRAMGALALVSSGMSIRSAIDTFTSAKAITIAQLPATSARDAVSALGGWLRKWRTHGRGIDHPSGNATNQKPPFNIGFEWALRDHDEGYEVRDGTRPTGAAHGKIPKGVDEETFRGTLGLPIVQNVNRETILWYPKWDHTKRARDPRGYKGEGRFASPVILRPYRDAAGWKALIIFVDARAWKAGAPVFLNGFAKAASLDLYEEMKKGLQAFT